MARRGPINRAILAGDPQTGVSIMKMDEGLDTGPIAMQEPIAIAPDLTAGELHDALARLGADLMMRALAAAERGSLQFTPQPQTGVTYAEKFQPGDPPRLDETLEGGSRPYPRSVAISRCVVRN